MVKEFITISEARQRVIYNSMKYKPITLLKKVVAYGLIGYGVVTCWLPSGSQLALLGGCALLGIPFSKVWDKVKDVWYCVVTWYDKFKLYGVLW